jgi:hypothetical protein
MDDSFTECTPFVPPTADDSARTFELTWWTESVWQLAKGIEAERALDRMPILADALEEAGCDDEVILRHCRECQHHEPDCWVLTTLLLPPSFPPNIEELLDLKRRIPLEIRAPDDADGLDPGPGGVRFQTSKPIPDVRAPGEPEQGYPRYQHPRPSPFALMLLFVIVLIVGFVLYKVFIGVYGGS